METVFGFKSIVDLLENKLVKITKILIAKNTNEKLIAKLINAKIKFELVEKTYFNKFDKTLNHQNCLAYIQTHNKYESIDEFLSKNKLNDNSLIVVLDEINDPRNFGSIIRTSYALGVDAIIYKKNNQAQINDVVAKTSIGASNLIPLIKETNLLRTLEKLKKIDYWVYTSTLSEHSIDYNKVDYAKRTVLMIGNEANGVSKNLIKNSDFLIKIPMKNQFESLNVAVATGIMISKIIK